MVLVNIDRDEKHITQHRQNLPVMFYFYGCKYIDDFIKI